MKSKELKEKLFEAYKAIDDYQNSCNEVWEKYEEQKEKELPWKVYLEGHRKLSAKAREYEKLYKEAVANEKKETSSEKVKCERTPYLEYLSKEVKSEEWNEKMKQRAHSDDVPTKDNLPNTDEKAKKLQERLVQCCIDYILETGDRDINTVSFHADSLQESANFGKWCSCTDSSIHIKTKVWDEKLKTIVDVLTGEYY